LHRRGVEQGVGIVDFERRRQASDDAAATLQDDDLPPLIVAAGGSGGGYWLGGPSWFPTARPMGRALLETGFSIRSMAYFTRSDVPDHRTQEGLHWYLSERPLEPIAARLQEARRTRGAQRRCIGFIGVSAGGSLTMALASYADQLAQGDENLFDAAVAVVPSHVVFQAPHASLRVRSRYALNGEPLAFVPYPWLSRHMPSAFFDTPNVRALIEDALRNRRAVEAAAFPVERIEIPVLMMGALQDASWPSAEMSNAALARAERLAPERHALSVVNYDLDHYLTAELEPILEATAFLYEHLRAARDAGRCEADFPPLRGEPVEDSL
jgi:pimeloyl-ACP methyl ester carboxylesterase